MSSNIKCNVLNLSTDNSTWSIMKSVVTIVSGDDHIPVDEFLQMNLKPLGDNLELLTN